MADMPSGRAEALAHLLAVLDCAVRLMDECGHDVDARVVEQHRAELARGAEWPGDRIRPWHGPDEADCPRCGGSGAVELNADRVALSEVNDSA